MVNLRKPVRECAPIHIRDEYIPEINPSNINAPTPEPIEMETQGISYSQLASKDGRRHLASVFREATTSEMTRFQDIQTIMKETLKRDTLLCRIMWACGAVGVIALAATVSLAILMPDSIGMIATIGTVISLLFAVVPCVGWTFLNNSSLVYKVLSTASDIFISAFGANSLKTTYSIIKGEQEIGYKLFHPYHCKDNIAFYKVTNDRHDVFIVYSDKYNAVVIVDPNLFS